MKSNYWQPRKTSTFFLSLIALVSLTGVGAVEMIKSEPEQPYLQQKLKVAEGAESAFTAIKAARLERGMDIDPLTNITQSGLLGEQLHEAEPMTL